MDILLIFLYIIGAYVIFLGISYVLVRVLFPKLDQEAGQDTVRLHWHQLRRLSGISMNVPQRTKRTAEKRYKRVSYPFSNTLN